MIHICNTFYLPNVVKNNYQELEDDNDINYIIGKPYYNNFEYIEHLINESVNNTKNINDKVTLIAYKIAQIKDLIIKRYNNLSQKKTRS